MYNNLVQCSAICLKHLFCVRLFITKFLCNQIRESEVRQNRLYDCGSFYVLSTRTMIERLFENVKGNYVPVLEVHNISYHILCPIYRTYHSNCGTIIMSCFFPIGRIFNISFCIAVYIESTDTESSSLSVFNMKVLEFLTSFLPLFKSNLVRPKLLFSFRSNDKSKKVSESEHSFKIYRFSSMTFIACSLLISIIVITS